MGKFKSSFRLERACFSEKTKSLKIESFPGKADSRRHEVPTRNGLLRKFRRLESSCANSVQLEDRSFLELSICDEKILRLESHVLLFEHKAYSLEKLLQDLKEKKTVLKSVVLEMEDRTSDENVGSTAQQTQYVDENVHQGFMKTQKIVSEASSAVLQSKKVSSQGKVEKGQHDTVSNPSRENSPLFTMSTEGRRLKLQNDDKNFDILHFIESKEIKVAAQVNETDKEDEMHANFTCKEAEQPQKFQEERNVTSEELMEGQGREHYDISSHLKLCGELTETKEGLISRQIRGDSQDFKREKMEAGVPNDIPKSEEVFFPGGSERGRDGALKNYVPFQILGNLNYEEKAQNDAEILYNLTKTRNEGTAKRDKHDANSSSNSFWPCDGENEKPRNKTDLASTEMEMKTDEEESERLAPAFYSSCIEDQNLSVGKGFEVDRGNFLRISDTNEIGKWKKVIADLEAKSVNCEKEEDLFEVDVMKFRSKISLLESYIYSLIEEKRQELAELNTTKGEVDGSSGIVDDKSFSRLQIRTEVENQQQETQNFECSLETLNGTELNTTKEEIDASSGIVHDKSFSRLAIRTEVENQQKQETPNFECSLETISGTCSDEFNAKHQIFESEFTVLPPSMHTSGKSVNDELTKLQENPASELESYAEKLIPNEKDFLIDFEEMQKVPSERCEQEVSSENFVENNEEFAQKNQGFPEDFGDEIHRLWEQIKYLQAKYNTCKTELENQRALVSSIVTRDEYTTRAVMALTREYLLKLRALLEL
ncbi:uncharacterized protein LOC122962043 [Acropora millepora]|uniref:uncharacterized protein LOC122962043 n=1 Tax=Acropora millepora TaxID=45264 RepID=UPI001CF3569F|nr:uncharacterized protein LOC122962043 [Acropora millepora]